MRTPITYYGGKQQLVKEIGAHMPRHKIYCEPFFGGGAYFFYKPPSYLEAINDINNNLITFYKVVQNNFVELDHKIRSSLHSESEYLKAQQVYNTPEKYTEVEIAWAVWILTNISFSGSIHGGWRWCNGTSGSHTGRYMNHKRNAFQENLQVRLNHVQISCRNAERVIKDRDSHDTFFYLDPPYPGTHQGHYKGYTFKELEKLLIQLESIKGKFLLSNSQSQTLRHYLLKNNWNYKVIDMPLKVANRMFKKRKQEVLAWNYEIEKNLFNQ